MAVEERADARFAEDDLEDSDVDVRLEAVSKRFGETVAVDGIDLEIERGEFFSLLGPSGCGKTTTLAMIGGFEDPTEGSVHLGGRDVTGVPPYRRDVNTVFQSYALFPHLNVFDNIAFGLRRKGVPKSELAKKVNVALDLVDLPQFGKRKPRQLSGGQQQRVALARALVNEPRVLLLDEPLGALDLKLRKQMQLELKRIQHDVGITFLYVTHDQEEAMVMSNRLAVMNGGKIEQVASPEEVYDHPSSEFVAGFLGASNLLPGRITSRDRGRVTIQLEDGPSVVAETAGLPASDEVKVGVRPEKLELVRNEPDQGWNSVEGQVRLSTYLGVSHQYTIEGPGGRELIIYVQNRGNDPLPREGERVRIAWRPEHSFVV